MEWGKENELNRIKCSGKRNSHFIDQYQTNGNSKSPSSENRHRLKWAIVSGRRRLRVQVNWSEMIIQSNVIVRSSLFVRTNSTNARFSLLCHYSYSCCSRRRGGGGGWNRTHVAWGQTCWLTGCRSGSGTSMAWEVLHLNGVGGNGLWITFVGEMTNQINLPWLCCCCCSWSLWNIYCNGGGTSWWLSIIIVFWVLWVPTDPKWTVERRNRPSSRNVTFCWSLLDSYLTYRCRSSFTPQQERAERWRKADPMVPADWRGRTGRKFNWNQNGNMRSKDSVFPFPTSDTNDDYFFGYILWLLLVVLKISSCSAFVSFCLYLVYLWLYSMVMIPKPLGSASLSTC